MIWIYLWRYTKSIVPGKLFRLRSAGFMMTVRLLSAGCEFPIVSSMRRDQHRTSPTSSTKEQIKLKPGEIVPVELEIWPSSTLFERGEKLQLIVQGSDFDMYPGQIATYVHIAYCKPGRACNLYRWQVRFSVFLYRSFLLVEPVLP